MPAQVTTNSSAPTDPRRRYHPRGQGFDATLALPYEQALEDPSFPEVFCYTDRLSYAPGESVAVHASSTVDRFTMQILRDAGRAAPVATLELSAPLTPLKPGFIARGCDWPVVHRWTVPAELPSGFYLMLSRAVTPDGTVREQEHGFFVRARNPGAASRILLVAATCTWTAYNDWGGGNHYMSNKGPDGLQFSPVLSIHRPFSRGLLWLPEGAPRRPHAVPPAPGAIARHPCFEFAYARGFSKFYASAGWATYERPFAVWAEQSGYALDYATQHDLHADPALLDKYDCAVFVGHDEYWTWEMRDAVERFIERGGHVARFAGNFYWQIRLEQENTRQVCYKWAAHEHDPQRAGNDARRLTANWEDPAVARPGAETFGLNGGWGIYVGVGRMVPHGPAGFTVYRHDHWSLAGTDLCYGDVLGGEARIFGYEVDGLDYVVRDGLPFPTFSDGAPKDVEIVALGLASNSEIMQQRRGELSYFAYYGDPSDEVLPLRYAERTEANRDRASRGSGMVVTFTRGAGTVFHAGTCEWVAGLQQRDFATEQVTRNVLDRFAGRKT